MIQDQEWEHSRQKKLWGQKPQGEKALSKLKGEKGEEWDVESEGQIKGLSFIFKVMRKSLQSFKQVLMITLLFWGKSIDNGGLDQGAKA